MIIFIMQIPPLSAMDITLLVRKMLPDCTKKMNGLRKIIKKNKSHTTLSRLEVS